MTLSEMSIEELQDLRKDLDLIICAAQKLPDLTGVGAAGVRIRLLPGELVSITAAWTMPECGACGYTGDPGPIVIIEDAPDADPAEGMVGGSGDLQRHRHAESPPAEPAASTPETGENPEAAQSEGAGSPAGGEPLTSPAGPVASEADPDRVGHMADDGNPNAWSADDERRLVEAVADRLAAGDTRRGAVAHGAALIGRTSAASDFRLRKKLGDALAAALLVRAERGQDARQEAPAAPEPAPDPAREQMPDHHRPAPIPAEPAMTAAQRAIALALARVPARKGFDLELDLEVVEGYARGSKTDAPALDLDLDAKQMLARMKELTACIRDDRGHLSIDGQADLLRVMRQRVSAARGAAA